MEPAIPEQSASQLNQREVVDVLLLVPHQDPAALRQPCERPLDHPSPRLVALRSVAALLFLADPADVRGVSGCGPAPSPVGLSYALSRGMCCGSSFVGSGRSTTILSIVAARSLRSSTFAPAITTPSGPPSPSVTMPFWCPFCLGRWDSCPSFSPPKRALPSIASAGCHSLHPAEFVTLGDQDRPDSFEDPVSPTWNQSWTVLLGPYRSGSWSHWQSLATGR